MPFLSTQCVVDDDLMEYELPSNHGVWAFQKKPEGDDKKKKSMFIYDSPPRPSPASLFVTDTGSKALAQPVEPPHDDSQCFGYGFDEPFCGMFLKCAFCFSICISFPITHYFYLNVTV